jgi:hypothetical protein
MFPGKLPCMHANGIFPLVLEGFFHSDELD